MGTDVSLTHAFAAGTLALWVPVSPPFAFALYPGFLSGEKLPSIATPLIIQSFGSDLIITGVFHDPGEVSFGPPRYLFEGVPPQPNCPLRQELADWLTLSSAVPSSGKL